MIFFYLYLAPVIIACMLTTVCSLFLTPSTILSSSILEPHLLSHSVWLCNELPGLMLTSSPGSTITLDLPAPILFSYVTSLFPFIAETNIPTCHP